MVSKIMENDKKRGMMLLQKFLFVLKETNNIEMLDFISNFLCSLLKSAPQDLQIKVK